MKPAAFTAIVLTHDRTACVARHMIARYAAVWPDHPFTFRIPHQRLSAVADMPGCEYVPAPAGIKQTVETLLADLPDDEWIYWCLDDKYPIRIDVPRIASLVRALGDGGPADVSGVLFCRARRMLDEAFLTGQRLTLGGQLLLERLVYEQIWIHQFVRVKVVRHLFAAFPDVIKPAAVMDRLKRRVAKPADHRLWVTAVNHSVVGESTRAGVLTENCLGSMRRQGMPIPDWQPAVADPETIIGQLTPGDVVVGGDAPSDPEGAVE
ncbi:MAG: hypothetical protein ACKON8_08895 [Planctomycetota bacterium]